MSEKNFEYYVGIHDNINGRVVAVCDSDLLGKTLEDENCAIEISQKFYGGELVNEEKVTSIIQKERNLNLVGKNIINLCLELEIITKDHIFLINDIPHVQLIEL